MEQAPGRIEMVLIVEDDESTGEAIAWSLGRAGLGATLATDGLAGLGALKRGVPDVLLLDLMLPRLDGWALIRGARRLAPQLPIIVISARTNEHDRVEVLRLGADDVVAKPFSMRELVARVQTTLRRASALSGAGRPREVLRLGGLTVDPERLRVEVCGQPASLTPKEFALLSLLAETPGRTVTRDQIHRRVWGAARAHGDRSVDVLVRRLRRKVDEAGSETYVQTDHGLGYRLQVRPSGGHHRST